MEKHMLSREKELRAATSLRVDMLPKLPRGCKIYHPLPRHGEFPEVPFEIDHTEFNGYDEQSRNGYFVRTALIGLLTGVYHSHAYSVTSPRSFQAPTIEDPVLIPTDQVNPVFKAAASLNQRKDETWIEVKFHPNTPPNEVRKAISRLRVLSDIDNADGYCQVSGNMGIHSIPRSFIKNSNWLNFFATFFSDCQSATIVVQQGSGFQRIPQVCPPGTVAGLPGLACPNSACVSHPDTKQRDVRPAFINRGKFFTCKYCEKNLIAREMFQGQIFAGSIAWTQTE
jgi:aspartate carbamoyltransferase